jgi:uncharacterized membrane protein
VKTRVIEDGQYDSVIDRRLGLLLRTGVMISALVVFIGGVLFLLQNGGQVADHRAFRGVPAKLTSLTQIITRAFHGDAPAVIQFGLLLLIATPVARVVFSVFAFAMERDFLYVGISVLVLCVLLCSILWR